MARDHAGCYHCAITTPAGRFVNPLAADTYLISPSSSLARPRRRRNKSGSGPSLLRGRRCRRGRSRMQCRTRPWPLRLAASRPRSPAGPAAAESTALVGNAKWKTITICRRGAARASAGFLPPRGRGAGRAQASRSVARHGTALQCTAPRGPAEQPSFRESGSSLPGLQSVLAKALHTHTVIPVK